MRIDLEEKVIDEIKKLSQCGFVYFVAGFFLTVIEAILPVIWICSILLS